MHDNSDSASESNRSFSRAGLGASQMQQSVPHGSSSSSSSAGAGLIHSSTLPSSQTDHHTADNNNNNSNSNNNSSFFSSPFKNYFQSSVIAAPIDSNPPLTASQQLASASIDSSSPSHGQLARSSAVRGGTISDLAGNIGRRKPPTSIGGSGNIVGAGGNGGQSAAAKPSQRVHEANPNNDIDPDSLQITPYHAVGFVILSSCFLLLMYFIDVYAFVSVLYLAAAAFATSKVFFYPFFTRVHKTCQAIQLGVEIDDVPEYDALGDSSMHIDTSLVISALISTTLCVTWFIYSEDIKWVWIIQDFLGISVCIMFLSTVHLPNLQAASMLLGLAFCYDVFFVFISPYVFGSSVMVKVATGPTVTLHPDENFCEKYPSDRDCDTNTLPMLLIVPTFSSYLSTESMLGLGDNDMST